MKITPTCVPCLMKRVVYEANMAAPDRAEEAIMAAIRVFDKEYTGQEVSAKLATKVHRAAYDAMGTDDPYVELKERSNQVATSLLPRAREVVSSSDDPLEAALRCAIAGNIMDFGIALQYEDPDDLSRHFETLISEDLGNNDLPEFRDLLREGARVVLFTDNCGEIILDGLLCDVLSDMGVRVTMVVKGEPILTDATVEDAERYGIDEKVDELLDTGGFAIGVDLDILPDEVKARMEGSVLILSKGMANYESFSDEPEVRPIVHLLRTKCAPIAESIGLPVNKSVIVFCP